MCQPQVGGWGFEDSIPALALGCGTSAQCTLYAQRRASPCSGHRLLGRVVGRVLTLWSSEPRAGKEKRHSSLKYLPVLPAVPFRLCLVPCLAHRFAVQVTQSHLVPAGFVSYRPLLL